MSIAIIPFISEINTDPRLRESLDAIIFEVEKQIYPKIVRRSLSSEIHILFLVIGTGGTEQLVMKTLEGLQQTVRIFLVSFPTNNSLPASLELRAALERRGFIVEVLFSSRGEKELIAEIISIAQRAFRLIEFCHGRIGIIGEPSDWLVASFVDPELIKHLWAIKVISIPLTRLQKVLESQTIDESKKELERFEKLRESNIDREDVTKALRLYRALKRISNEEELTAFTIRCFDILMDLQVSACLPLSILTSEEGIIAGCEGDFPTLLTMIFLNKVTDKLPFMGNVCSVDGNELLIAHCTVPIGMCESLSLTTHFETNLSVAIKGKLPIGEKVVIGRIANDLTQAQWFQGTTVANVESEELCRTAIKITLDEPFPNLLKEALANHYVLVFGDFLEVIKTNWEWLLRFRDEQNSVRNGF